MCMRLKCNSAIKVGTIIFILLLAAMLLLRPYLGTVRAALFDVDEAIHIEPESVERSTLIIGTHLIYLHSLNDQIYAIAAESASSSGQDKRYYKSELAGGMWMDITEAESLRDITAAGKTADADEIRSLYFTHHTKSDGITYDLRTGSPVCVFDIFEVYDLEQLPELESLKTQYDMMKESKSSTKTAKRSLEYVRSFFAMQVRSDMTERCDAQIQALQGYYGELVANGADSKDSGMVLRVMEKIDNARKAAVFTMVDDGLASLQEKVADVDDKDGELELDDTLLTAIGNSRYTLSESLNEARGNMLARGDTVLSETEYTLASRMISNAESSDYSGCDGQNQKLQHLDNIGSGRIVSRQEELALLDEMIEEADVRYGLKLSEGETEPYRTLVSQNVSHAALQSRMREDMTDANAARSELEFLIQAKADRQEKEEAQAYVLMRIQDAAKFKVVIRTDAYQQEYQNSVSVYVDWLNSLLTGLSSKGRTGSSQDSGESLYEQKASLQEQKLQALDNLDLDTAKRIDAEIANIDEKIGASENHSSQRLEKLTQEKTTLERQAAEEPQNAVLQAELSRLEVEIANCRLGIPENSQAANIMACKEEILSLLAEGDTSDAALTLLESDVSLLESTLEEGSALALEASKEVYGKLLAKSELEDVKAYRELQEQIEGAISESVVSTGLTGEMSVQSAGNIIADALGIENVFVGSTAAGGSETRESETGGSETGESETGNPETGSSETESPETESLGTGSSETGESETGNPETGSSETESPETESLETESSETRESESGSAASGESETESSASGSVISDSTVSEILSQVSQEDLAAALIALGELSAAGGGTGESAGVHQEDAGGELGAFAESLASALSRNENSAVFLSGKQGAESYVPAEKLAVYAGWRYVWNDTGKNAVLSRGRFFYSFTAFRDSVENEKGEKIYMEHPAGFSGGVYIPASFAEANFDCSVYDISGTDYAVLVNDKVIEKSQELLDELTKKGGY